MTNNIAVIPARGGSKRVPLKNIKNFLGQPILTRTIQTLLESKLFDSIVVSTDSEEVKRVALQTQGVSVIKRSPELASDSANTVDVIADVISELGLIPTTNVCCVYAPNPFLKVSALKVGLTGLTTGSSIPKYVSPVTTYPFPIQRSLKLGENGELNMAEEKYLLAHSQSLEQRFHETAQFWWALAETWSERLPMQLHMKGIYTPRWMSQDIDTLEDWTQAEVRFKIIQSEASLRDYIFTLDNLITESNSHE